MPAMTFTPKEKPYALKPADQSNEIRRLYKELRITQVGLVLLSIIFAGAMMLSRPSPPKDVPQDHSGNATDKLVVKELIAGSIVTPYFRVVDLKGAERIGMVCGGLSDQPAMTFSGMHGSKLTLGMHNNNHHDNMQLSMTTKDGKEGISISSGSSADFFASSVMVDDGKNHAQLLANGKYAEMGVVHDKFGFAKIRVEDSGYLNWQFRDSARDTLFATPPDRH